jgi:RHS repeat-associated protein
LTSEGVTSDPHANNFTNGFTYDAVGNRKQWLVNGVVSNAYTYDPDDRLGSDQYDPNGNTTSSFGVASAYDFENHMVQKGAVMIVYDGDGNRVSETVGSVTTNYLVDTQNATGYAQVVDELQSGAVARTYSYGLERISETQPLNSVLATSFYGYDGHGNVRQLTNSAGAVTDTYDYDAFGNIVNQTGNAPNNYLFAGEQYDPALGLYYNRARYLNTTTGRFWSMDSYEGDDEEPLSLHKYLYASGDTVDRLDPSGHDDLATLAIGLAVAAVLVGLAVIAFGPTKQAVKQNVQGAAGVQAAKVMIAKAIGALSADARSVRRFFKGGDTGAISFNYQRILIALSGNVTFTTIASSSCHGCAASAVQSQDSSSPLQINLSELYYPLPAYPSSDADLRTGTGGGVIIHETSHAVIPTIDYVYYWNQTAWSKLTAVQGILNADSYRVFAEYAYLHD